MDIIKQRQNIDSYRIFFFLLTKSSMFTKQVLALAGYDFVDDRRLPILGLSRLPILGFIAIKL